MEHTEQFTWTLVYVALGVAVFGGSFFALSRVLPFSIRKEIEEDHNTALAIILASVVLGLAQIIAAAID